MAVVRWYKRGKIMRVSSCVLIFVFLGFQAGADDGATPAVDPSLGDACDNQTLIATVFGKPLFLESLNSASVGLKRKELPRDEFHEWLRKYRGRRIYQIVWGDVMRSYVEREKLSVTEEEISAITDFVERRLKSAAEVQNGVTFTPEEHKESMIVWGRGILLDWKVCRSLYEKYGGRVGIGSLGAWTAFDGQNALLREHHKAGDINFHHAEMEEAFWRHTRTDNFADAYPKGEKLKRLLATPPYLQD
jgi:hypothetical protein